MTQRPAVSPVAAEAMSWPDAIEVDRVVPPSGNMTIGPQQFWLGTSRASVVHEASGQQDTASGAVARDKPGDIRWSSRDNGRRGGGRGRRRA